MRNLRIVFMGTPEFAVATLDKLIQKEYQVVGVITAPDKPAGRGRKIHESSVKQYAKKAGLHIMQPTNLKDEEFLNHLRSLKANLQIVVAFRMLPKQVWSMPKYGTFNLHASLLPDYRGAAPINWAIINGEKKTGVTTFFIDEKIDTGELILQETTEIGPEDTAGDLHDSLMILGAELVLKTVSLIENNQVVTQKQPLESTFKTADKINKETCKINWEEAAENIYNHIRGLSPFPAAWTNLNNDDELIVIKIYKAKWRKEEHNFKPGSVLFTKKELKVASSGGYVYLTELQLPGKRKMAVIDVLNGLKIKESAFMT
ncbi:methionyl-tRNA formyltransferase [uncultured Eudoraea sp.]|uniref:methionyl-tRNA formyltransferase n=1 Tax=uncultured Eudoraea sp. TaxID=1035614 RepID=UPI00260D76AE|nr:methionyl-tRNA formyltransferase [uncultured Eudoraea sp.]